MFSGDTLMRWLSLILAVIASPVFAQPGMLQRSTAEYPVAAPSAYTGECTSTADLAALPESHWCETPNSQLNDLAPSPMPYGYQFNKVMLAWNGGTFDTVSNRLLVHGHGHDDGPLNGIWGFNLSNFQWEVVEPSSVESDIPYPVPAIDINVYNDGRPTAVHTYYGFVFDPVRNAVYRFGGSRWRLGNGSNAIWEYDFDTSTWTEEKPFDNTPSILFGSAAYIDDLDLIIVARSDANLRKYTPSTNDFTEITGYTANQGYYASLVWDSDAEILVQMGRGIARHITFNAGVTVATVTDVATTGCTDVKARPSLGAAYNTNDGKIYYYLPGVPGTSVFSYDTATRVCTEIVAAGGNLVTPDREPTISDFTTDTRSLYGRWQYVPSSGVFVGVGCTTCNVFFWKPPS